MTNWFSLTSKLGSIDIGILTSQFFPEMTDLKLVVCPEPSI